MSGHIHRAEGQAVQVSGERTGSFYVGAELVSFGKMEFEVLEQKSSPGLQAAWCVMQLNALRCSFTDDYNARFSVVHNLSGANDKEKKKKVGKGKRTKRFKLALPADLLTFYCIQTLAIPAEYKGGQVKKL